MRKKIWRNFLGLSFLAAVTACSRTAVSQQEQDTLSVVHDTSESVSESVSAEQPVAEAPLNASLDMNEIMFGFCDEQGSFILVQDSLGNPEKYIFTVSARGEVLPLTYIGKKPETAADTKRQNWYNFEAAGGHLYKLESGKLSPERTAMLFTHEFMQQYKLMPRVEKPEPKECSPVIKDHFKEKYKRRIKKAAFAALWDNTQLCVCEFTPEKDSALAAILLNTPDARYFAEYPAHYDEISTWRVDDGGNFMPENYTALALFRSGTDYLLLTDWPGAEGTHTTVFRTENGVLRDVKHFGRYEAPL